MNYTEKELKTWFDYLKLRFPNSKMKEHLEMVEMMMFKDEIYNLRDTVKKMRETETGPVRPF